MLSHLGIIREAKAQGWPHVLILEDDCELEPYALPILRRAAEQLAAQPWDMLYLGGTFKKGGKRSRYSANLERASRIRLGHAYVVNARLYDRILAECGESGLPIDWYYSEVLQSQVECFLLRPVLAYQRLLDMSDIESVVRRPEFKTRKTLRRLWSRLRYGAR
jgi:glycosyl transferase family 25